MIWNIVTTLLGGGLNIAKGWSDRKKVRLEGELELAKAVTQAKIEQVRTKQMSDVAWENTALVNAGIKDEIMMFVVLLPMVMCFFPGGDEIVRRGFNAMAESLPDYWEYAFYATISVSYGLRKFVDMKKIIKDK